MLRWMLCGAWFYANLRKLLAMLWNFNYTEDTILL